MLGVGSVVGSYTLESAIAGGGMGVVYYARHNTLGTEMAVKVLLPNFALKEKVRHRFKQEAYVQSQLNHDHIVRVFDLYQDDESLAIIMEYVRGPSLEDVLANEKNEGWTFDEVRNVMGPVLDAAIYAHDRAVVHRDFKPGNILLERERGTPPWPGSPKITDFGLAKILASDGGMTRTGARMGTTGYMAPEQFRGDKDLDARADVFALGMMAYRLLAGQLPVNPEDMVAVVGMYTGERPIPRLDVVRPDVPAAFADAVAEALTVDPSRRPKTVKPLLEALDAPQSSVQRPTADSLPPPPPPPSSPPLPPLPPPSPPLPSPPLPSSIAPSSPPLPPPPPPSPPLPSPPLPSPPLPSSIAPSSPALPPPPPPPDSATGLQPDTGHGPLFDSSKPREVASKPKLRPPLPPASPADTKPPGFEIQRRKSSASRDWAYKRNTAIMCAILLSALMLVLLYLDKRDRPPVKMNARKTTVSKSPVKRLKTRPARDKKRERKRAASSKRANKAKSAASALGPNPQPKFVLIKPGTFRMGSPKSERGRSRDEKLHTVRITRGFYLQTTEVTQGQYKALVKSNPSHFKSCGKNCPVEKVSWYDALRYCNLLSKKNHLPACYTISGRRVTVNARGGNPLLCKGYRLPTEAEWEHAAHRRGGAWHRTNSGHKTHPVAQKLSNAVGLYDMIGNVYEWAWDWYGKNRGVRRDPRGPHKGKYRVRRGCSWASNVRNCRAAYRSFSPPPTTYNDLGFRPARSDHTGIEKARKKKRRRKTLRRKRKKGGYMPIE